ncbi:MAG: periplasmic heavy metal sensor [Methanobacteriota archaeon]|nr:MAG: periplasmic heavy metal sensor [Euryarchaeota archaeon]
MRFLLLVTSILLPMWCSVFAQTSPYAGQEEQEIKALTPSQIEGYLTGKGMGLAKAAELNHYPGPKHVLDLAKELGLTEEQLEKTKALFASMKTQAIQLGQSLVEKEKELDRLFATGEINSEQLDHILMEIGKLQAKLRYVHMKAHLDQKQILTPHQVALYDKLRGYGSGHLQHDSHKHLH